MSRTVGYYWKLIRYYVNARRLVGFALLILIIVLVARCEMRAVGSYSPRKPTTGVVLSAGPVDVPRACGGIQQFATVKLADGSVVEALVDSGRTLKAGTAVHVVEEVGMCRGSGYIAQPIKPHKWDGGS